MYIGLVSIENGIKIIIASSEKSDDYQLEENEIKLSEEIYKRINENSSIYFVVDPGINVGSDNELGIDDVVPMDKTTRQVYAYVARYVEEGDKKWIMSISMLNESDIDLEYYMPIDKNLYNFLSVCSLDLGLRIFYVDRTVDRATTADLKKSIEVQLAEKSADAAFDMLRQHYTTTAMKLLRSRLDDSLWLAFARLQILSNTLINKGFIITDENREDQYLEIINKDDEKLLKILSDYLDAYDNVSPYVYYYTEYTMLLDSMSYAETKEELQEAWYKYAKKFF